MWNTIIKMSELKQGASWRPESFCVDGVSVMDSGFPTVHLGTLVSERKETFDPQDNSSRQIYYLGLENIEPVTGRLIEATPRDSREIRSRSKVFAENDVLYGRLRAYLNKVYVAVDPVVEGICSTEFFVLKPDLKRIQPVLLRALLSSAYVVQHIAKMQTGSALPRVHLAALLDIEVPLPPLEIQRAYAEFLSSRSQRQQALAEELATFPSRVMQDLVAALKRGAEQVERLPEASYL
jgi:type I restriction enzyme S subunit